MGQDINSDGKIEELGEIYREMDDEGKELMVEIVEDYLNVQNEKRLTD